MKSLFILVLSALLVPVVGCNDRTPRPSQRTRASSATERAGGKKQFVVYDFWAPWCGPCREFAPTFEKWKAKYSSENITFKKVNVDEDRETASMFRLSAIPTLIVTANGEEVGRFVGAPEEQEVVDLLK
jgi:thioredoxin 1